MRSLSVVTFVVVLASLLVAPVGAEEGPADPYGGTYTTEELAALDRALHAVNCDRGDLCFDRDHTKGHQCFPVVREMLQDPLAIAPWMERLPRSRLASRLLAAVAADEGLFPTRGETVEDPTPVPSMHLSFTTLEPDLAASLAALLAAPSVLPVTEAGGEPSEPSAVRRDALRLQLPPEMAWHDVFPSPFEEARTEAARTWLEGQEATWVHEEAARIRIGLLIERWTSLMRDHLLVARSLDESAFPETEPLVLETPHGRIAIGTKGDDVYEGEFQILIEPGGNDRYVGCRIGAADGGRARPIGLFLDLEGDDVYACGDVNVTLGAAILGVAAFLDLGQGDDRYEGGHASLGAAMGGVAVFYDDGGSDVYEGKTFTQGAAGFGVGLFYDHGKQARPETSTDEGTKDPVDIGLFDNDRLSAWSNAQAFARCRGIALCVNERGNDVYHAGGVYLHAPLFSDRYQSFSQGFAIGARGIDYAGGIAMLIDHDGNDRYLGDIYNQGVGYWYSAGLLWDGGGNDTYEMTQYGQGSGIHLAVGGLVDVDGNDTYVMHSGLGQGGSHDYACSILHDRGGNDHYHGATSCNGCGLTNSVGLHLDRAGNDVYAGRRKSGVNFGRPARGFSSLGILLDLEGTDDYLGVMDGHRAWRHTDVGVGLDLQPAETEEAVGSTAAADQPSGQAEIPAVCAYEGKLTKAVFQELWDISRRWEVGDNRVIVPRARERLVRFGNEVLPFVDEKVETDVSGLDLRAYVGVLRGLEEAGETAAVQAFLARNAKHEVVRRKRVALHLIGELKQGAMAPLVVDLLKGEDEALARRAAGVLATLGSRAGDAVLRGWLQEAPTEATIKVALPVLLAAEDEATYAAARPLLGHPLLSVRSMLATLLARHLDGYAAAVDRDLGDETLDPRARRTLLDAVARSKVEPTPERVVRVLATLAHEDWGMRADAARVLVAWTKHESTPEPVTAVARSALGKLLAEEDDPFVRFCAGA